MYLLILKFHPYVDISHAPLINGWGKTCCWKSVVNTEMNKTSHFFFFFLFFFLNMLFCLFLTQNKHQLNFFVKRKWRHDFDMKINLSVLFSKLNIIDQFFFL